MLRYLVSVSLTLFFLISCKTKDSSKPAGKAASATVIDIQPFDDIQDAQIQYVYTELKKIFYSVEIKRTLSLPAIAFYKPRNRYRADTLIHFLSEKTITGHKVIGLTSKDISTTKNKVADWGIMGLGFCPGKACIASTYRVSKEQIDEQLFKVAIHELGHTFGLPHCEAKYCFMRDAEGGNPTNDEKEFCVNCRSFLKKQGWLLN